MKVLVTGAHGFVGSHACRHLHDHGHAVRGLVSPWGDPRPRLADLLERAGFSWTRGDLRDRKALREAARGCEVVVHAAGRVADYGPWRAFEEANVRGTENVADAARAAGARRLVFVSSVAVFRYRGFDGVDPRALPRDNLAQPYGRSKILAEDAVLASGLEPVLVRPALWPFGPADPNFARIARALRRGWLPLVAGGRARLQTVYVENLVEGLRLACEAPAAAGRSYLIADHGAVQWRTLFAELATLLHVRPPRFALPGPLATAAAAGVEGLWSALSPDAEPPLTRYRASLMRHDLVFDDGAARQELAYRPRVSREDGLRRAVEALP